jgi:precorrin-6B methylase 2
VNVITYFGLFICIAASVGHNNRSELDQLKEKDARLEERVKALETERASLRQEILHLRETQEQLISSAYRKMTPQEVQVMEKKREKWERLSEVSRALGLKKGSVVADVGAGQGFFAVRFARMVGSTGRVFAVDADKELVRKLKQRVQKLGLRNIDVVQGSSGNPMLPSGLLDAVLIADAHHEMKEYRSMLSYLRRALKPDGRIVVMDYFKLAMKGESRDWQVSDHNIDPELVKAELQEAGLRIVDFKESFNEDPDEHIPIYLISAGLSQNTVVK